MRRILWSTRSLSERGETVASRSSISLPSKHYEAIRIARGAYEQDVGRQVSLGEFLLELAIGYMSARQALFTEIDQIVAGGKADGSS